MPMITSRFSIFWTYGLIPGPPTALSWKSVTTCSGRHHFISKGRISIAAGSTQVCWSPVGHADGHLTMPFLPTVSCWQKTSRKCRNRPATLSRRRKLSSSMALIFCASGLWRPIIPKT